MDLPASFKKPSVPVSTGTDIRFDFTHGITSSTARSNNPDNHESS
jgi:hypothetical protein